MNIDELHERKCPNVNLRKVKSGRAPQISGSNKLMQRPLAELLMKLGWGGGAPVVTNDTRKRKRRRQG